MTVVTPLAVPTNGFEKQMADTLRQFANAKMAITLIATTFTKSLYFKNTVLEKEIS